MGDVLCGIVPGVAHFALTPGYLDEPLRDISSNKNLPQILPREGFFI